MSKVSTLVGSGLPPAAAQAIVGYNDVGVTATGTNSQTNSYAIQYENTYVSTAGANSGVRLPANTAPGDEFFVYNGGASTMHVYPPTGGNINGGSTNAAYDLLTLTSASFRMATNDGLTFAAVKSA